ncbi:MAG: acetylglutamate kinase [Chloroflexi bacterium]|nr:acetylglutamate kinase [Chloroflexota bacterium]
MRIIKISGHQLDDAGFVEQFAAAVAEIGRAEPVVIINGGGKSISALQQALGLAERKIDGLRVTDGESLAITEMVMSAQVNKLVVRALQKAGLDALGLSGVDGRLLTAQKKHSPKGDLGFVGEIIDVRVDLLRQLIASGLTPVISPVACDVAGQHYNVNADEAATAVAQAISADQLDFVSNVPGVYADWASKRIMGELTTAEANQLIATGTISGGMIPKVQSALQALAHVPRVRITNLDGLVGGGTVLIAELEMRIAE